MGKSKHKGKEGKRIGNTEEKKKREKENTEGRKGVGQLKGKKEEKSENHNRVKNLVRLGLGKSQILNQMRSYPRMIWSRWRSSSPADRYRTRPRGRCGTDTHIPGINSYQWLNKRYSFQTFFSFQPVCKLQLGIFMINLAQL